MLDAEAILNKLSYTTLVDELRAMHLDSMALNSDLMMNSSGANDTGNTTHKTRYLSYIIADEFRQTSMDLTRLCRTYVSTGDQKYWDAYFDIVNWRSGKQARPSYVNKDLYDAYTFGFVIGRRFGKPIPTHHRNKKGH